MIRIDRALTLKDLVPRVEALWDSSAEKILRIEREFDDALGAPVFTAKGVYTARGWTEWTQGFRVGSALLQYEATGDERFLELGRAATLGRMTAHVTHMGVHDHGFNNVSTFGNLLRLILAGRADDRGGEAEICRLALKCSGAVQASRWTRLKDGSGYIYSFNGPHSLFADTIRSLRVLALAHRFGHVLLGEGDVRINLLERLITHARSTAAYNVYYGRGRDAYDVRGRVAHESVFNVVSGIYSCPSSQQGYSPFTTWTRGLAWIMCGFAEQLEFVDSLTDDELDGVGGRDTIEDMMFDAASASCDFYIEHTPTDGIPYWDTGAPGLTELKDGLATPADPYDTPEPVDSSAAVIAAQGLLRLSNWCRQHGRHGPAGRYMDAGLLTAQTVLGPGYLSESDAHHGLILHSVYHRPNGWDYIPTGHRVPCGESSMWGDYHARELALYLQRLAEGKAYPTFWGDME